MRNDGVLETAPVQAIDLLRLVEDDVSVGELHDFGCRVEERVWKLEELVECCERG